VRIIWCNCQLEEESSSMTEKLKQWEETQNRDNSEFECACDKSRWKTGKENWRHSLPYVYQPELENHVQVYVLYLPYRVNF
jgi:hypothetical protein